MRLPQNTVAPTALAFIALIAIVPVALLAIVLIRVVKGRVNPFGLVLAMLPSAPQEEAEEQRSKGWKGLLDAVAHARLF